MGWAEYVAIWGRQILGGDLKEEDHLEEVGVAVW